jgi:preprotein translocase subunit SecB
MEQSPLRLEWVAYPSASFKARIQTEDSEDVDNLASADISCSVVYSADGKHTAELKLSSKEASADGSLYDFSVEVVALFYIDIERAKKVYLSGGKKADTLPVTVAVNVVRILYSSARELLATFSARGPFGGVMVESVLIGPEDVKIRSTVPKEEILRDVFKVQASKVEARRKDG